MSSAKITLIGMYSFDHTLFDNMVLPSSVDKELLIDSILEHCGEYEVTYSDPFFMKRLITSWSRRWLPVFNNWARATDEMGQIAPLDNYNRHEEWNDTGNTSGESTNVMKGTGSTSGSDTSHGEGVVNNDTTDTSKISADDSSDFVNKTQDVSDNTQSNTTDTSATTSTTSETSTTSTANNSTDTSNAHNGHIWGNIGVTTSAAMFNEFYMSVLHYGNIYDSIAVVFGNTFIIPVTV
jgi:hypothetical protein